MYRTALCAQDSQPVRLPAYVQAMISLELLKYESNCMKFSLLAGFRPLFIYLINSAHEIVKMTSGASAPPHPCWPDPPPPNHTLCYKRARNLCAWKSYAASHASLVDSSRRAQSHTGPANHRPPFNI